MQHRAIPILFACLAGAALPSWSAAFAAVQPQEEWIAMYMQGSRIGYSRSVSFSEGEGKRVESTSVIRTGMLGASLSMDIETTTLYNAKGRMTSLKFLMSSAGRTLKVNAAFGEKEIAASSETGGQITRKRVPIPAGATIVDDPAQHLVRAGQTGSTVKFFVFDPNSLSLVSVTATDKGRQTIEFRGKKVTGRVVDVDDPRAPLSLLLDEGNRLIRATGPMGMEMVPEPKETAMVLGMGGDIAIASSIRPDRPLPNTNALNLKFSNVDLGRLPSDQGQKVARYGNGWLVSLTPIDPAKNPGTLKVGESGGQQAWTLPDLRVPSDQPAFKALAQKLIGRETNAVKAAEKVRQWVLQEVSANAGIGVMRDAREVLETKEGVCRDHAVLMAALLRSVGIPTKLVSGLVHQDGAFYYHAWVEVWNGKIWVPKDSTRPSPRLTVGHVKIASGSVADAFVSFLLDGARIEVVIP